ncbi:MAG: glycoside hydrolase family 2 protein [Candidatus Hodarchaeota archaeon]
MNDDKFGRVTLNLNGKWSIIYDPSEVLSVESLERVKDKKVTSVPSVFDVSEEGAGYTGVAWYQRFITIPPHDGIVELFLEGWYGKADFYLDSLKLGTRLHGYTPFSLYFKPSTSDQARTFLLSIRIDNREQPGQTFRTPVFRQWGGLHRSVALKLLPGTFIKSVHFRSDVMLNSVRNNRANADVKCDVLVLSTEDSVPEHGLLRLKAEVKGMDGDSATPLSNISGIKPVVEGNCMFMELDSGDSQAFSSRAFTMEGSSSFNLWSPDSPALYELQVSIASNDSYRCRVGIREIGRNDKGKLLMNGRPVLFLGVNRHDEHPEFGPAFVPQLIEHDLSIMKEAGFTGIRPAHYPTTNFFLDICDQMGIMVMEEVPNYIMMPEMMKDRDILKRGRDMFKEMISAHYNHPSIIAWSAANECKSHLPESKDMINALCGIAHEMDPKRFVHFTGYPGIQNIAGINADIAGINVYYGDSTSGKQHGPEVLGPVLDNLREFMEDEDLDMANVPLFITEFGSQAVHGYHDIHPYQAVDGHSVPHTVYTEERQAFVIEKFFEQVMNRSFVSGLLAWCWRDNRYEPEIAESCAGAIMRYGLLDWTGAPKLGFHVLSRMIKKLIEHRKKIE